MTRTRSGVRRLRALARRSIGRAAEQPRPIVFTVPLGAKLELTHRCNLRCGFCYTDSPRRTLERPTDITDAEWLSVVDQAIELGVLEAVVTGGEPLLRRDLALDVVDRLAAAGISTMLSTNGWHVDDAVADRLSRVEGLRVHISLDGACPATHDASRGVAGGWQRAIRAIDRLASRGIKVIVVHVLSPGAEKEVAPLLRQAWALGVSTVRLSPIVAQGAARGGAWTCDMETVRAAVREASLSPMAIQLQPEDLSEFGRPRAAFLVRPNGDIVPDSRRPFAFGNALEDGLTACWERLAAAGGHAESPAGHNPYMDPDVRLDGRQSEQRPTGAAARAIAEQVQRGRAKAPAGAPDLARADAIVEQLVLARRYRLGAVRRSRAWSDGEYVRVLDNRHVHRLNATASAVLDAGLVHSLHEVIEDLGVRHPSVERTVIQDDVLRVVRDLEARGVIAPVPSPCA